MLMTTSPALIRDDSDRAAYLRVEKQVRLTRYGGDCYAYCALAAGFVDLVIETNLKPHDIVALAPIIEGAGGVVTTWDGENAAKGGGSSRRATGLSMQRRAACCSRGSRVTAVILG
jgi:myo-inositol-1(or 4)-monophosphatase